MDSHYYSRQQHVSSDPAYIDVTLKNNKFRFKSDRGVFSKNKIDFGSVQLIESFTEPEIDGPFLDVGCGYGPIGLTLAMAYPKREVHMVDVNERALSLAKHNAQLNNLSNVNIYESDRLQQVTERQFAAILTNPPIRAGKQVVHGIFSEARERLQEDGELWVVIQKKQGAPSALKYLETLFEYVDVVNKVKGYYILRASKKR